MADPDTVERYETCDSCGRPTAPEQNGEPTTHWHAPDDLWLEVEQHEGGLKCIECFTRDCVDAGIPIRWEAVRA